MSNHWKLSLASLALLALTASPLVAQGQLEYPEAEDIPWTCVCIGADIGLEISFSGGKEVLALGMKAGPRAVGAEMAGIVGGTVLLGGVDFMQMCVDDPTLYGDTAAGLKVIIHGPDYDWGAHLPPSPASGERLFDLYQEMKKNKLFDKYEQQDVLYAMQTLNKTQWTVDRLPEDVWKKMQVVLNIASSSDPEKLIKAIRKKVTEEAVKKAEAEAKKSREDEEQKAKEKAYLETVDWSNLNHVYVNIQDVETTQQYREKLSLHDYATVVKGTPAVYGHFVGLPEDGGISFNKNTLKCWYDDENGAKGAVTVVFNTERTMIRLIEGTASQVTRGNVKEAAFSAVNIPLYVDNPPRSLTYTGGKQTWPGRLVQYSEKYIDSNPNKKANISYEVTDWKYKPADKAYAYFGPISVQFMERK